MSTPDDDPEDESMEPAGRDSQKGLPWWIILLALALFGLGYYLFTSWRSQYVDYSDIGSRAVEWAPVMLTLMQPL